jgi:hypothetical protein
MYKLQSNQPKTWKELESIMEYISDCDPRELRLDEDTIFYDLYKGLVPRNIALDIIKKQIGSKDVAIVKNNFPYTRTIQLLPGVIHYCLWSLKGVLTEKKIIDIVTKKFPNNIWCKSERKLNYKSVPELWHCHIFVKN